MKKICVIGGINIDLVSLSEHGFLSRAKRWRARQFDIVPGRQRRESGGGCG